MPSFSKPSVTFTLVSISFLPLVRGLGEAVSGGPELEFINPVDCGDANVCIQPHPPGVSWHLEIFYFQLLLSEQ